MFDVIYKFNTRGEALDATLKLDSPDEEGICPFLLSIYHPSVVELPDYDSESKRLELTRGIRTEEALGIRAEFEKTTVPCVPSAKMLGGFDGSTHEITICRGITQSVFRWWVDVPDGWDHLAVMAGRIHLLSKTIRDHVCRQHQKKNGG